MDAPCRVRLSCALAPDHRNAGLKLGHGNNWHEAGPEAGSGVQQKLRDARWQSLVVSAPGQVQSGQMRQKIILNLELADHAVKLGHFGLMVDLFLFALAKEVCGVLDQFLIKLYLNTII
jgi:hypothetical protein